jgi:hypothetical protein
MGYEGANFMHLSGSMLINLTLLIVIASVIIMVNMIFKRYYRKGAIRNVGSRLGRL